MPSREASLRNLKKARASWSHPPRPWRSFQESRLIERLAWQWFNAGDARQWSERAVARWLGVSHTYVQKLVRKFQAEPDRMREHANCFGPATFEQLNDARESTRQAKERAICVRRNAGSSRRFKSATTWCGLRADKGGRTAAGSGSTRPSARPSYVPSMTSALGAGNMPRVYGNSVGLGCGARTRDARKI